MAPLDASTIRARMVRIRSRAQGKAVRLTQETKQFLDWKYYVKVFPWSAVGVAAVAGYLLVPSRRVTPTNIPAEATNSVPASTTIPETSTPSAGMMTSLMGFVANAAMRTAVTYAGQALGNYLANLQQPPQPAFDSDHSSEERNYAPVGNA